MTVKHIVIIGAARSGTKLLRDVLADAAGIGKVPYDINFVWRYGNESRPDDAIPPDAIKDHHRRFIKRYIGKYASGGANAVIEKTVGNSVRVSAVTSVLPDAVFVHLIRDGVDVIESTRRQWTAPTDTQYLVRKIRHFPLRLTGTYGLKYVRSIARRGDQGHVASWGVRYPGINDDLKRISLLRVCARQWREAVVRAREGFATGDTHVVEVRYENLVSQPEEVLSFITEAAGLSTSGREIKQACGRIGNTREGAGRGALYPSELKVLDEEVGDLLIELGYEAP